jgi:hypothetical protein
LFAPAVCRLLLIRLRPLFSVRRGYVREQFEPTLKMAKSASEPRAVILMLCEHLKYLKGRQPRFAGIAQPFTTDSYVLLQDATQMFCRAVSESYGEEPTQRWNDFLPEFLLLHPERCDEVLGLIEQKWFEPVRYLELAGSSCQPIAQR